MFGECFSYGCFWRGCLHLEGLSTWTAEYVGLGRQFVISVLALNKGARLNSSVLSASHVFVAQKFILFAIDCNVENFCFQKI